MTSYHDEPNAERGGTDARPARHLLTLGVFALVTLWSFGVAAESTESSREADAESPRAEWRVEASDEPPIQVRRAADRVEQTASATASSIGGSDDSAQSRSDDTQTSDEQGDRFDEALDLGHLERVSDELLAPDDEPSLALDPYVDDARWFDAVDLLEEDEDDDADDRKEQCKDALETIDEVIDDEEIDRDKPAVAYTVARARLCADKETRSAEETLSDLGEGDGAIAELARRVTGESSEPEAETVDEAIDYRDRIEDAKQRAAMGEVDAALVDLEALHDELTKGWARYQVRIAQVYVLERSGRLKDAARHMLGVYRDTRTWSVGDHVEERLEGLDRRAGTNLLTMGERVDRMRELIQGGRYLDARKLSVENAKMAGVTGNELDGWGDYRRGLQAEKKRDREQAVRYFERADVRVDSDVIRPRLYFGWARALRRLDRDEEAIELYERLCDEYPTHRLCEDSLFEAGRLSQYLNRHEAARQKFAQVIGLFPDSDNAPEALWRGAFSAYLMGDYDGAVGPLEHLKAHYGDQKDASELSLGLKAQYWIGVSKLKAGDKEAALEALQKTVSRGPLTWYGRLAATRLKEAGEKPRADIPDSPMSAEQLEDPSTLHVPENERLEVAAAYTRLGLYDEAIAELREQTASLNPPERAEQMLAAVYLADGRPDSAHWIMKRHIAESGPAYHTLRDWGVAFPTNYMEHAHRYGREYGVSPFLVQAIIRQESGFRQKAKSPVGARGLMQLMPGTARYTQREYVPEGGGVSLSSMVEPDNNVRLGTMYVRLHTAFATDRVPLALAGYNAGPAPLKSWIERYGDRELDAWVESITYREARGYVRKVFTSYITYAGLYGDGSLPEISLEMPDELREWGDVPEFEKVDESEPVSRR
ncbi:MAG: transglycosylase SLT domain-containing protein [Persicimonas sp.]